MRFTNFQQKTNNIITLEDFSGNVGGCKDLFTKLCVYTANRNLEKYDSVLTLEQADEIIIKNLRSMLGLKNLDKIESKELFRRTDFINQFSSILEIVIDDKVDRYLQANKFFKNYSELYRVKERETIQFKVKNQKSIVLSEHSGNSWSMERQRLNSGKLFSPEKKNYAVHIYEETARLLNLESSFVDLVDSLFQGVIDRIMQSIVNVFQKSFEYLPTNLKHTGNYDSKELTKLLNKVSSMNGGLNKPIIIGNAIALDNLFVGANNGIAPFLSDRMKDEINETGMLGTWRGYRVIELPQIYNPETGKNTIDEDTLYIVSAEDKFIKGIIGTSFIRMLDFTQTNDMTTNFQYHLQMGFAGIFGNTSAKYKITV